MPPLLESALFALSLVALACQSPAPTTPTPDPTPTTVTTPVATPTTANPPLPVAVAAPTPTTATVAEVGGGPAPASSGAAPVAAPAGKPGPVLHLTQGKLAGADADLTPADEKVRACLARSKGSGEVVIKITVATSGFALSATATPTGDVSKEAVLCARNAMRDHTFGKPVGGGVAAAVGTFKAPGP